MGFTTVQAAIAASDETNALPAWLAVSSWKRFRLSKEEPDEFETFPTSDRRIAMIALSMQPDELRAVLHRATGEERAAILGAASAYAARTASQMRVARADYRRVFALRRLAPFADAEDFSERASDFDMLMWEDAFARGALTRVRTILALLDGADVPPVPADALTPWPTEDGPWLSTDWVPHPDDGPGNMPPGGD